jgi:fructose-bisphosphate aldolase class I
MASQALESVALSLVAEGKGILAADETIPTLTRRFDTLGIKSTEQSRRTYREMLFTSPGAAEFICGVIMYDETIRQKSSRGTPLAECLAVQGILPGIKVDMGAKPLAGSPDETVTEGLDGLRGRLSEYRTMGARFAKWRAVIRVTASLPSSACVSANAQALARYAALCQEQELVPIVEPEVLMDGSHTIERCDEVTGAVLHAVFNALFDQDVALEGMLLKPNMVVAGKACTRQPAVEEVATATLRCLRRHVPAAVPGIVFLSGGPKCTACDCTSERNQPAARPEALENQFLLWPGASGSGSGGLAWPGRESGGRPECPLSASQLQQCGERWEIYR